MMDADIILTHADELLDVLAELGLLEDSKREIALFCTGTHTPEAVREHSAWMYHHNRSETSIAKEVWRMKQFESAIRLAFENVLNSARGILSLEEDIGVVSSLPQLRGITVCAFLDAALITHAECSENSEHGANMRNHNALRSANAIMTVCNAVERTTAAGAAHANSPEQHEHTLPPSSSFICG